MFVALTNDRFHCVGFLRSIARENMVPICGSQIRKGSIHPLGVLYARKPVRRQYRNIVIEHTEAVDRIGSEGADGHCNQN